MLPNIQRAVLRMNTFKGSELFTLSSQLGTPYQLNNATNTQAIERIAQNFLPKNIAMVAGLGNPQGFFDALAKLGIVGKQIPLPDHANYTPEFFKGIKAECILITEKDAVKCANIEDDRIWVVPLSLQLPDSLMDWMQSILQRPDPRRYTL
jgi:tetraacyldisaccharide 4'-kinase